MFYFIFIHQEVDMGGVTTTTVGAAQAAEAATTC